MVDPNLGNVLVSSASHSAVFFVGGLVLDVAVAWGATVSGFGPALTSENTAFGVVRCTGTFPFLVLR